MRVVVTQNSSRSDNSATCNRLVQVLWFPEFTLPVEGTHFVEEEATLVRWHVEEFNVCNCFSHRLGRQIGKSQTMLV